MTIPVVWITFAEGSIARGHWHDEMLGDLFDRKLWRPVDALEYVHVEVRGSEQWTPTGDNGHVVVISGAENADHVADLNRLLAPLPWCLVIVAGDENHLFPRDEIDHPHCEVWAMCTRPGDTQRALGFGYAPGTREELRALGPLARNTWMPGTVEALRAHGLDSADVGPEHALRWSFVGQVTNRRRTEMVEAARLAPPGVLIGTDRFAAHLDGHGLARDKYIGLTARSKVVLCPSGPHTVDSFRLFEALEAGAIPFADAQTPEFQDMGYWVRVFGEPPPFRILYEWSSLTGNLEEVLPDATAIANRCSAFYQAWKRRLAYDLDATVMRLSNRPQRFTQSLADQITVIVTTSPAPLHPSTEHIEETIASIRAQLPDSEIIVVADGVRPEQEDRRADYDEYLARLTWLCNLQWSNVLPILQSEWGHQANAMRAGLAEVRTPLVLFVEHDTPLCGEIDWAGCASAIRSGSVNVIRFHHEAQVLDVHQYLMLDAEPWYAGESRRIQRAGVTITDGVPLLRTVQWSQRPHLAPTLWYQDVLTRYFAPESRTFVEDVLYGVVENAWNAHGMAGWERWRLALYAPPLPLKRSEHLDSRGDEPKHPTTFAYPGPAPAGAPRP